MKQIILAALLSPLTFVATAQQNQPATQEQPVFPDRVNPSTLQRDSLTVEPQLSPSNAKIIAEPAGEQPSLDLQRDSTIRERKSRRTEKE